MKMTEKQPNSLRGGLLRCVAVLLTVSLLAMALAGCATVHTVEPGQTDESSVEITSEAVESAVESEAASEPTESATESEAASESSEPAVESKAVVAPVSSAVESKAVVAPASSTVSYAAVEPTSSSAPTSSQAASSSVESAPVSSSGGSVAEQTGKRRIPMYLVAENASNFTVAVTVNEQSSQLYTEEDFKDDPENPGTKKLRVNIQTGNLIAVTMNGDAEIVDVYAGERGGTDYLYESIGSEALGGSGTEATFTIESMKIDAVQINIVG